MSELVARLSAAPEPRRGLRDALTDTFGDPTLILAYCSENADTTSMPKVIGRSFPTAETAPAATAWWSKRLTNVAKYAQASSAEVRIGELSASVTVEVSDDGEGDADPARGSGPGGLARRAASLHGRLEADSPPGRGTAVRAKIPCA